MDEAPQLGRPPVEEEPEEKSGKGHRASFEEVFHEHYDFLLAVLIRKFSVPVEDADQIIQEVFMAYLAQRAAVFKLRPWLIAVTCNGARSYWRDRRHSERIVLGFQRYGKTPVSPPVDQIYAEQIAMRETIEGVSERSQSILRMHYYEGYSAAEIATKLETTPGYAEKLIHQALQEVRSAWRRS